jgi:hypothetical protein
MKARLIKNIQVTYLVNPNERTKYHFWIDENGNESLVHSWNYNIPDKDADAIYIGVDMSEHNIEAQKDALFLILKRFEGTEVVFLDEILKESKKATKSAKKEAQ